MLTVLATCEENPASPIFSRDAFINDQVTVCQTEGMPRIWTSLAVGRVQEDAQYPASPLCFPSSQVSHFSIIEFPQTAGIILSQVRLH